MQQGQEVQPTAEQRQTQNNLQKLKATAQTCSVLPSQKEHI